MSIAVHHTITIRPTSPPASARVHSAATTTATTAATATTPSPSKSATTVPTVTTTSATTIPTSATAAGKPLTSTPANARVGARTHPHSSGHVSTEAVVLAAIAALLLLACAAWAFARSRAYEPHWLLSLRHAMAEAGFRLSATWAEFSDWVRLGH
jgi:hypothetical protein